MTDAVLKDAWAIHQQVDLKDYHPSQVVQGLLSGDIDATFWMQVWETLAGHRCSFQNLVEGSDIYWINLSVEDIDRINAKSIWKLDRVLIPKGSLGGNGDKQHPPEDVGLPSFTGAICAWDSTEEEVIYELVKFIDAKSELWPDFSGGSVLSLERMSRYPGIDESMVHTGALKYYKEKNINIRWPA